MSEDAKERAAQEWFRKGTEAMNHRNWDFAIECFGNCVRFAPHNVMYRQTRHGCIRKKYDDNGSGARMAGVKLMGVRGKLKKSRMQKKWKDIDTLCEEGLAVNPWDAGFYFEQGAAAAELDYEDVAKYSLSRAVDLDKENIDYNRRLGHFLRERGDYDGAIRCFERIRKQDPQDGEARSLVSQLQAESVMDRGGYEKAKNTRDVKSSEPEQPVNAYEEDRRARRGNRQQKAAEAPGESAEADMQHAIRKDPENISLITKLAGYYREQRDFGKAIDQYQKAMEASGNSNDVRELLEDTQLEQLREKVGEAVERARKNPDKERPKKKAMELQQQLLQKEIDVFAQRVEQHSSDMRLRFQLAERYRKVKEWGKAIPLYQQASADSRMKEDSLVALGECFVRDGKLELGRRQFMKALESISPQDKPNAFKSAHYWLGRLYEKAGKTESAETHYTEILSQDYEYKDVLKRLETLQTSDDGGLGE